MYLWSVAVKSAITLIVNPKYLVYDTNIFNYSLQNLPIRMIRSGKDPVDQNCAVSYVLIIVLSGFFIDLTMVSSLIDLIREDASFVKSR